MYGEAILKICHLTFWVESSVEPGIIRIGRDLRDKPGSPVTSFQWQIEGKILGYVIEGIFTKKKKKYPRKSMNDLSSVFKLRKVFWALWMYSLICLSQLEKKTNGSSSESLSSTSTYTTDSQYGGSRWSFLGEKQTAE